MTKKSASPRISNDRRPPIVGRKRSALLAVAISAALATACVTVNVNFPESAVQNATDNYVRDLYRAKKGVKSPGTAPEPSGKSTSLRERLLPSAHAGESFNVNTPAAQRVKDRLAARLDEVMAQKRSGVLGESADGKLVIKAPEKLKALLAQKIEKLVAEENGDRENLYEDVLSANGLDKSRLRDVAKSFARSFQAESPSGTWVQDAGGGWAQKP